MPPEWPLVMKQARTFHEDQNIDPEHQLATLKKDMMSNILIPGWQSICRSEITNDEFAKITADEN